MPSQRFTLVEYEAPLSMVGTMAQETGLPPQKIYEYLQRAGERAAHVLNFSNNPLSIVGNRVQAIDFAGLLRAGPAVELEIVPKFLGGGVEGWREDFFFLAMLSRHGRLLSSERLRALTSANADLLTLVARAFVQMFWDQHRRPVRKYRKVREMNFSIDGEVEPEFYRMPTEDGFPQTVLKFDRSNIFNAAIKEAAKSLGPLVKDAETKASLDRIANLLGPQTLPKGAIFKSQRLPSRARAWQATYDLALDILQGFGLTYQNGQSLAPGFLVSTWQVWEDLLTIALRAQLGGRSVEAQKGFHLGHRQRRTDETWGNRRGFAVTPDLAVDGSKMGFGRLLVDAKYKGRKNQSRQAVSEADIYEALAFARASKSENVVLVYPMIANGSARSAGTTEVFERIEAEGVQIWGLEAEVRGISRNGGVRQFAQGLITGLQGISSQSKSN